MGKIKFAIFCFVLLFFVSLESSCVQEKTIKKESVFENFVTVSGNKLMDGTSEIRFISYNIPNMNFVEDEMAFTKKHAFRLPSSFEIRDALKSVKQMGGKAVRMYTIPVKRESDIEGIPRYVLAPGEFDENSFKTMDTVLAIANEVGIRLIVPLVNSSKWMGALLNTRGSGAKIKRIFGQIPS